MFSSSKQKSRKNSYQNYRPCEIIKNYSSKLSFLQAIDYLLITFDEQFLIISHKISFLRLIILTRHVFLFETKIQEKLHRALGESERCDKIEKKLLRLWDYLLENCQVHSRFFLSLSRKQAFTTRSPISLGNSKAVAGLCCFPLHFFFSSSSSASQQRDTMKKSRGSKENSHLLSRWISFAFEASQPL